MLCIAVPGLNKVARKLNIDCVPAMVGWEAHCGFSHPILEGFIVCEEFKDTLLAAWDEEQEINEQREREVSASSHCLLTVSAINSFDSVFVGFVNRGVSAGNAQLLVHANAV